MTIALCNDTRPAAKVTKALPDLAVALFVATQRAVRVAEAAEQFNFLHPSRLASLALEEARREAADLAEAHGLLKALCAVEDDVRQRVPEAFGEVSA